MDITGLPRAPTKGRPNFFVFTTPTFRLEPQKIWQKAKDFGIEFCKASFYSKTVLWPKTAHTKTLPLNPS